MLFRSEAVNHHIGRLDVLVNNAGVTVTEAFEKTTVERYDSLYQVNLRAMFFLAQAVLPAMENQGGGKIINISSIHAYCAMPEHAIYAGTKGGIVAFTRTLALELIKKKVRVNCIAPGWILIEKHLESAPKSLDWNAASALIPTGFIGLPRDVGRLALFFASEESRYIIGQTVLLDGGQSIVMPLAAQITDLYEGRLSSQV